MGVNRPGLRQGGQACSTSLWRPTIVLPQDARYWDDSTLASVLAHELVHIKRRDDAWLFGFRLCALLYWWLPWIASMYAAFVRCVEESCDDAAAEWVGHDLTYIEALAGVAVGHSRPPLGGVTHMHQHHLVGRIGRFGKLRDIELDTRGVYWSVTGVLAVVGFLSGIEPVQEVYAAQTVTVRSEAAASARVNSASVYPVTHQYTLFPAPLSDGQHKRLYSPSYAAPVIYPGAAIRQGIEGVVTVAFYVNADGAVSSPRIVSSEPAGLFEGAALRAVLNSRYPAARHGVARQTGAYHAGSLSSVEVHRYFAFRLEQR